MLLNEMSYVATVCGNVTILKKHTNTQESLFTLFRTLNVQTFYSPPASSTLTNHEFCTKFHSNPSSNYCDISVWWADRLTLPSLQPSHKRG